MALAYSNPLQTTIAIGGMLQASLPAAVRQANLQLIALNRSVMRVNESMTSMGRRAAVGLLGLAGVAGITEIIREGVALAKEEAGTRAALSNLIMNQNRLRGIGVEQSKEQVEALERQAKLLQSQSGIYSGVLLKGDAYLAQFKLTAQQIQSIQPAMMNLLVYQRQMGRSAEEMPAVYEAMGKGIMGQAKGLKSIGVELSDYQQRILKMNAMMGRYAAKAAMIAREIQRQHGGAVAAARGTLGGQAAIAMAGIKTAKERIGEAFRPLIQLGQVIVSRFFTPLTQHFNELNKLVMAHWKEWVSYIDRYVVPAFKRLLDQGWQKLIAAVQWFQRNSEWFLPWLKRVAIGIGAWTFAIGPLLEAIKLLREALMGLSLSNPFTALAVAAGLAAAYIITHWTQVKNFLGSIWEWIVGTKMFNPNLEPAGVLRAYPKGVTPRAQAVQIGWIGQIKGLWSDFFNWLSPEAQKNLLDIQKRFKEIWGGLVDWWNKNVAPALPGVWEDMITVMGKIKDIFLVGIKAGIEGIIKVVDFWLIVVQKVGDAFKAINDWLDKINEHRYIPGMGMPKPDYGPRKHFRGMPLEGLGAVGTAAGVNKGLPGYLRAPVTIPYDPGINVTHYGYEAVGSPDYDWRSAHGIGAFSGKMWSLSPYGTAIPSAALLESLRAKYGIVPGQRFSYMGHMYRYEDVVPRGYRVHGVMVPYRDLRMDIYDPYKTVPSSTLGHPQASANVTLNYNVGGITIHGAGSDMEQRLAQHHRRHIDQMKRDLAEVIYRGNRVAFDGARAV